MLKITLVMPTLGGCDGILTYTNLYSPLEGSSNSTPRGSQHNKFGRRLQLGKTCEEALGGTS
eukprot:c33075_g1_i1 orf=1-183(-)